MQRKTVTVTQIRKLDDLAINKYGVPSIALMENAGCWVAQEVIKALRGKTKPFVVVFCGTGNNAGDGFVAARHLINAGVAVKIYVIFEVKNLKADAAVNYQILKKLKCPLHVAKKVSSVVEKDISRSDIVVDAIFGVGLSRDIEEPFLSFIHAINKLSTRTIAVDVPSGLNGTTGEIFKTSVKAWKTITFSFAKKGFYLKQGPRHTGKVVVVDIGIPKGIKIKDVNR